MSDRILRNELQPKIDDVRCYDMAKVQKRIVDYQAFLKKRVLALNLQSAF